MTKLVLAPLDIPDRWYEIALSKAAPLVRVLLAKSGGSHVTHKYIMKKPDGKGGWVYYYRRENGELYSSGETPQRNVDQWLATVRGAMSRLRKQMGDNPTPAQTAKMEKLKAEQVKATAAKKAGKTHATAEEHHEDRPTPTELEERDRKYREEQSKLHERQQAEREAKQKDHDDRQRQKAHDATERVVRYDYEKTQRRYPATPNELRESAEMHDEAANEHEKAANLSQGNTKSDHLSRVGDHRRDAARKREEAKRIEAQEEREQSETKKRDPIAEQMRQTNAPMIAARGYSKLPQTIRSYLEGNDEPEVSVDEDTYHGRIRRLTMEDHASGGHYAITFDSVAGEVKLHDSRDAAETYAEKRSSGRTEEQEANTSARLSNANKMSDEAFSEDASHPDKGQPWYLSERAKKHEGLVRMWSSIKETETSTSAKNEAEKAIERHNKAASAFRSQLEEMKRTGVKPRTEAQPSTMTELEKMPGFSYDEKTGEATFKALPPGGGTIFKLDGKSHVWLATKDGGVLAPVSAVEGDFAVHGKGKSFTVTHIPSGFKAGGGYMGKAEATAYAKHLQAADVKMSSTNPKETFGLGAHSGAKVTIDSHALSQAASAWHKKKEAEVEAEKQKQRETVVKEPILAGQGPAKEANEHESAAKRIVAASTDAMRRIRISAMSGHGLESFNREQDASRKLSESDPIAFAKKLHETLGRDLKSSGVARSSSANYKGTGSKSHRRQFFVQDKDGPGSIDIWVDSGSVQIGGITRSNMPPVSTKGKSSAEVAAEVAGRIKEHFASDVKKAQSWQPPKGDVPGQHQHRPSLKHTYTSREPSGKDRFRYHYGDESNEQRKKPKKKPKPHFGPEKPQHNESSFATNAKGSETMSSAHDYDPSIRKSFRIDGTDALSKGLYKFAPYNGKSMPKIDDEYLPAYLDAFIEEAYEHECHEKAHGENTMGRVGDMADYWATFVWHELVSYMPSNTNLERACKKLGCDASYVAQRIRDLNLLTPQNDYATVQGDFMGGYMESEIATSGLVRKGGSLYDEVFAASETERSLGAIDRGRLAKSDREHVVLEGGEDPMEAFRKSADVRDAALGSLYGTNDAVVTDPKAGRNWFER